MVVAGRRLKGSGNEHLKGAGGRRVRGFFDGTPQNYIQQKSGLKKERPKTQKKSTLRITGPSNTLAGVQVFKNSLF